MLLRWAKAGVRSLRLRGGWGMVREEVGVCRRGVIGDCEYRIGFTIGDTRLEDRGAFGRSV